MEKNNYIVAVDLGSSKVTVAAASKDPDGRLNIIDLVSRPMEGMERGEVTNIEQVTAAARDALGELEENLGIHVTEAYAGISGEDIRCGSSSYFVYVNGQDGEIRDEDVTKLHESMNTLPPPEGYCILDRVPQKYTIDSREETMKPVGRFGHRLESTFNFILGNKNSVERLTKAMNRLQVKTKKVFTTAQASAAAVLTEDEKELGAAVIDIGAGCTDICIWYNNIMRYVSVLPVGSGAINTDIRSMAIREKMIEKLKVKYGYATAASIPEDKKDQSIVIRGTAKRDDKAISYLALTQIIEARLLDIVEHVMAEIKESGYADKLGAGLILTGGGAKMSGIDNLFRDKTKYEVRIAGADAALLNDSSLDEAADIANTSAIGLLLLGAAESRIHPTASPLRKKGIKPAPEHIDQVVPEDDARDPDINEPASVKPKKEKEPKKPREPKQPKERWWTKIKKEVFDFEIIDDEDDKI